MDQMAMCNLKGVAGSDSEKYHPSLQFYEVYPLLHYYFGFLASKLSSTLFPVTGGSCFQLKALIKPLYATLAPNSRQR